MRDRCSAGTQGRPREAVHQSAPLATADDWHPAL